MTLLNISHLPNGISSVSLSVGVQYLTKSLIASPPKGSSKLAIHLVSISLVKFDDVR